MSSDPSATSDLMTIKEVAQYFNVSSTTIFRLLKSGNLPAFKVGNKWRFHRREIDEWSTAQTFKKPRYGPQARGLT
jgi:excisionase family DNA binding protein